MGDSMKKGLFLIGSVLLLVSYVEAATISQFPITTSVVSPNAQTLLGHTFSQMQSDLGLVPGTNVQAQNGTLQAIAQGTYTGANSITTVGNLSSGVIPYSLLTGTPTTLSALGVLDLYNKTQTDSLLNTKITGSLVTTIGSPGSNSNVPTEAAVRAAISAGGLVTGNAIETGSNVLTINGGSNAIIGTGLTIQVKQSNGSQGGYLSSTDWTTFNNKGVNLGYTPLNPSSNLSDLLSASTALTNLGVSANGAVFLGHTYSQMRGDLSINNVPNVDATNPINIVQTPSYRFVTDTQIAAYAAKQPALGFTPPPNTLQINGHALTGNFSISAGDVGLGLVSNLAPADLGISTATQSALNAKITGTLVTTVGNPGNDTNVPTEAAVRALVSSGGVTTGNLTETGSSVLTVTGGGNAVIGTGTTIQVKQAATSQSGFLSSTDWNTFNNKGVALGFTPLNPANNLSEIINAATARTNLGISANGSTLLGHTFSQMLTDLSAVSTARTINTHALSSDVIISASDLTTGTLPHAQLPALQSGDIPSNAANTSGTSAGLTAAYIDWNAVSGGAFIQNKPTLNVAGNLTGTISSTVLGNSTHYIGTTAIALNRGSGAQSLTGISSIDGNAATATLAANSSQLETHSASYFQVALTNPVVQANLATGVYTFLGTPTISNFFSAITDEGAFAATLLGYANAGAVLSGIGAQAALTNPIVAAGAQSITGAKTFDSSMLIIKGSSTGTNTIANANASGTSYTNTIPAKAGTFAMTSDITGVTIGTANGLSLASQAISLAAATNASAGAATAAQITELERVGAAVGAGSVGTYGVQITDNPSSYTGGVSGKDTFTGIAGVPYFAAGTGTPGRLALYSEIGTGSLSATGTPSQYQWASWTDSSHVAGTSLTASRFAVTNSNGGPAVSTTLIDSGTILNYSGTGGISTTKGTSADALLLRSGTTGGETTGWQFEASDSAMANTFRAKYPATEPTAGQVLSFGTPSSHVSTLSYITPLTTSSSITSANLASMLSDENTSGGFMTDPATTAGDLFVAGASGVPGRLGIGTDNYVLTMSSSTHLPVWAAASGGFTGGTLTSALTLKAGAVGAGAGPLYFQSGLNLTSPVAGAMEYDGTSFYLSPSTTRYSIPLAGATAPLTFTTGGSTARLITFPDAAITVARTDAANSFTGVQTMTSPALTTPVVTTDIHSTTAGSATLGTAALPFGSIYLGNAATNNFQITGTAAAARQVNINDTGGTSYFVQSDATSTSAGKIPLSTTTAGKYTLSTPTYPSTSGTARKVLVSDGTNNIYSTETYAVPGTAGNYMVSDGTNWVTCANNVPAATAQTPTAQSLICGPTFNNYGQAASNINNTLPTPTQTGQGFIASVGTAQGANYWRFTAGSAGTMYLDGSATGKDYMQFTTPAVGSYFTCFAQQTGASTWRWNCKTGAGTVATN